jgi:hypothetical protein
MNLVYVIKFLGCNQIAKILKMIGVN